jgi:hypothetical protein
MMHTVLVPVAVVLVLASLQTEHPKLYRPALYAIALLYLLGIAAFVWGLSSPELYGKHIAWSELAYKVAVPICIGLFSLPLCLETQPSLSPVAR